MKKELYVFSGLGADERVFVNLNLSDFNTTHVEWIKPLNRESIESYAKRLCAQIKTPNPVLLGMSFGGMMAVEIAKQIETEKVILISSAKTKQELPSYYHFSGRFRLYKFIPMKLLMSSNFLVYWFFGAKSKTDKQLLKNILKDSDPTFFKWAIDQVARWKNETLIENYVHIHGTNDRVIPVKNIQCTHLIEDGGHLMVFNMADELNQVLKQLHF